MRIAVCAALVLGAISQTAHGDGRPWFVAFKVATGEATIDDITSRGTIGTGEIVGPGADGELRDTRLRDYGAILGFAAGRRIGRWQVEADYAWRYRTDWDNAFFTHSINTVTNVFGNVESSTLMLNLIRRGAINDSWSWELGLGAGLVQHRIDAEYIEREVPGVSPERVFDDRSRRSELSYNLIGGVTRAVARRWRMNLRYRYADLGAMRIGPFRSAEDTRPGRVYADHFAHEIVLSFERTLEPDQSAGR